MITADGSEGSKIQPAGLNGYIVPDPLPSAISVPDPVPCETPEPATIPADDEMEIEDSEFHGNSVDAQDDEILEVDDELDQNFGHELVGNKFTVHYDYGWFTGVASWFNVKLQKLRLSFDDGSDDYISVDEVDGIDVMHI